MKLINRTSVFYNGKIVTHDDISLSEVERKLLFTPVLDYTQGGIISGSGDKLPAKLTLSLYFFRLFAFD